MENSVGLFILLLYYYFCSVLAREEVVSKQTMDPLLLPKQGVKTLSDDEEDDVEDVQLDGEETWNLRVKSLKDVSILVRPRDTVKAVKDAVRQALGPDLTKDRPYTRLVCKGRLLAPDAALLKDLSVVQPDDVVHAVLSASAPREGPQAALQRGLSDTSAPATTSNPSSSNSSSRNNSNSSSRRNNRHRENATAPASSSGGPSRRAWRGAGINADGLAVRQTVDSDGEEEEDDEDSVEDIENGGWMGFDRLRRAGLRRSDVVALRVYFGRSIDRFVRQNSEQTTFASETDPRRRRLLQEEMWMAAQGPLSEFRLNINPMAAAGAPSWAAGGTTSGWNNTTTAARGGLSPSEALWRSGGLSAAVGTDRDFIWGFLLGF